MLLNSSAISEEEKNFMKQNLMLSFDEPVNQVVHVCLILLYSVCLILVAQEGELSYTANNDREVQMRPNC